MKEEKSLIKTKNSFFSKIIVSIKRLFSKTKNNNYQNIKEVVAKKEQTSTQLSDMETLQQVMQGQVEIIDLEENTIERLVELCSNRLKEVNKKIIEKEYKISQNKKIIADLRKL